MRENAESPDGIGLRGIRRVARVLMAASGGNVSGVKVEIINRCRSSDCGEGGVRLLITS